jgi:photosystem II stability/assembly factor-like uncharacterized protein
MSDVLKADMGAVWIQRTPGGVPEYVGCLDLDDIASPQGDVTLSMCRDANGKYATVGRSSGVPGAPTTSITVWIYPEKSVLDDIIEAHCPVTLYALSRNCGRADVFTNYVRGRILLNALLTNVTESNIVKRIEAGEQAVKIDFTADFPVSRVRNVTAARQSIAETAALNDVAFCDAVVCSGSCGPATDAGENGFAGASPQSGSPGPSSNTWFTADGGTTWGIGATDPFAAAEDIYSVACFDISATAKRRLVAREKNPAKAAQVAYSDNDGATWTTVTVGAVWNEGAADQGALFALDLYHVWFVTTTGRTYFSSDGGATWTLQGSFAATGGASMNVIRFSDPSNGYAVGDGGIIIATTDGGDTWALVTDPTAADDVTALHVFSKFRVIIGTDDGDIYQTWDGGDNFTLQTYPAMVATDTVQDIAFVNDAVGYMISDTVAPVGRAYRTVDGGNDWQQIVVPTNAGLNALSVINENLAYAVGNAQGGTAVVVKITG